MINVGVHQVATRVEPTRTSTRSGEFRPEIQALRAIAVLGVLAYHLWPHEMRGGFVGVDVFFVISGFLISRHLISEAERTGRISLRMFWARRIRRLLPAAIAVILFCLILLFIAMPTVTWSETLVEIRASSLYVQNWLLGRHAVDYLASEDNASMMQHYWSLSVEEQFYLVWPLIVLTVYLLTRRFGFRPRSVLLVGFSLVLTISLAMSVVETRQEPAMAFFATPVRAWEFAAGGLLVIVMQRLPRRAPSWYIASGWVGLLLILVSYFAIDGASVAFPGTIALLPVSGALLVILSGPSTGRLAIHKMTSASPLQWVGDHSYSIYLWHWPLIIAAPWVVAGPVRIWEKLAIAGLSLILAHLTKRWIEDPFRVGPFLRKGKWRAYWFAIVAMVLCVGFCTVALRQVEHREETELTAELASIDAGIPCFGDSAMIQADCRNKYERPENLDPGAAAADIGTFNDCQQDVPRSRVILCTFGDVTDPKATIAIVGNSHALRLVPALEQYGSSKGWKIVLAAKTDCLGLTTKPVGDQASDDPCLLWSASVQTMLLHMKGLSGVIFASHVDAQQYLAGVNASSSAVHSAKREIVATWAKFRAQNIPVVVLGDVPGNRPDDDPTCIARSTARHDPCAKPRSEVVRENLVTGVAESHEKVIHYISLTPYFCDRKLCHSLIGGLIVYSDSHHLTISFSRSMGPYLGARVAEAIGID